jgi:hypothetical protein
MARSGHPAFVDGSINGTGGASGTRQFNLCWLDLVLSQMTYT